MAYLPVRNFGQIRCGMCIGVARAAAPTRSEGAVTVRFIDDPVGGTPLGRRSRHLPTSVIIHANEIERVLVLRCS
jgi:hypothetical protein